MKRLLIVGAGGHGRSVAESASLGDEYSVVGFLDDGAQEGKGPWPVLGRTQDLEGARSRADVAIVAIGNNRVRQELSARLKAAGFELASVVHPRAIVAPSARIGAGCAVMAGAIVGTEAELGEGAIVNSGSVVDHHCRLESWAHIGTNASMAGGSVLGSGAWIQAGSALGYGVSIPPWTVLAPGVAVAK